MFFSSAPRVRSRLRAPSTSCASWVGMFVPQLTLQKIFAERGEELQPAGQQGRVGQLKYQQESRLCLIDLLFSILPSAPKAWGRGGAGELGSWYLLAVEVAYVVGSLPSQEKGLAPEGAEPLGHGIPSSCLSFWLCARRLCESAAVLGWGSGEMPHSGADFPPFSSCH